MAPISNPTNTDLQEDNRKEVLDLDAQDTQRSLTEAEARENQERKEEGGLRDLDMETVGKARARGVRRVLSLEDVLNGPGHSG